MSVLAHYRRLLSMPHARSFFLPSTAARLGAAMLSLAILWAVRGASGSFAVAGTATGAFAVAEAFLAPQVSRLVDSHGQRRIGRLQLVGFGASGLALLGLLSAAAPVWTWVAACGVMGVSCPQIGSLSAARWRQVTHGTDQMPTALALEAGVIEGSFMVGPVLVTLLGAGLHPSSGLALAWTVVLAATGVLLGQRSSEPPRSERGPGLLIDRRLLTPGFLGFSALHTALGCYFGGIAICLTAAATGLGFARWAGVVAAAGGVLSLLLGLAYGAVPVRARPQAWMVAGSLMLTGCLVGLGQWSQPVVVISLFVLAGGCVAAVVIPAAVLLQRSTPDGVYVQAITWTGSASALGTAIAGPALGHFVDHGSWSAGALLLAGATATIPVLSLALGARRRRDD